MQEATPPTSLREQLTTQPPLMWFSLAFLGGIVLGSLISLSLWMWIGLALVFIVLAFFARFFSPFDSAQGKLSTFHFILQPFTFILFFALFLGAARFQYSVPKFDAFHIAFFNDRDYDLLITGTLAESPDYRDTYTNLRVKVEGVDTGDEG